MEKIMKTALKQLIFAITGSLLLAHTSFAQRPWNNGNLQISGNGRYLMHENGTPFFWLADTGWLLPERLDRDEAAYYLEQCSQAGFNVVQVQTVNNVPAFNAYGQSSMPDGFDFSRIDREGTYGYWDHMDYIVRTAERNGIYIGMVCIWGGLVRNGLMNEEEAQRYGTFLANRYKDCPNIVWIIGGDTRGDQNTEVWEALARAIKSIDRNHLMTFHPFGRTLSTTWFNDAEWLDFHMFQSGHRRYGQRKGDGSDMVDSNVAEDNWRYAEASLSHTPLKPVLDGEPSYEDIPHGLHNPCEARWTANDVRRYAYWSVFAGACGHTYGHNSIMQFHRPGYAPAYGARIHWMEALQAPGFRQMQHLKSLILRFPYFDRIPDQSVIAGQNGERYDRLIATRGKDFLLVYNYSARPMQVDLTKISGAKKKAWWYHPTDGRMEYIGEFGNGIASFQYDAPYMQGHDRVLVATDAAATYVEE